VDAALASLEELDLLDDFSDLFAGDDDEPEEEGSMLDLFADGLLRRLNETKANMTDSAAANVTEEPQQNEIANATERISRGIKNLFDKTAADMAKQEALAQTQTHAVSNLFELEEFTCD